MILPANLWSGQGLKLTGTKPSSRLDCRPWEPFRSSWRHRPVQAASGRGAVALPSQRRHAPFVKPRFGASLGTHPPFRTPRPLGHGTSAFDPVPAIASTPTLWNSRCFRPFLKRPVGPNHHGLARAGAPLPAGVCLLIWVYAMPGIVAVGGHPTRRRPYFLPTAAIARNCPRAMLAS